MTETNSSEPAAVKGAFGPDGLIKYVSASAQDVLGLAPEELAGRHVSYLFAAKDMARINDARDKLSQGDNCEPLKVRPRRKWRLRKAMTGEFTAMFDTISGAPHLFHFSLIDDAG